MAYLFNPTIEAFGIDISDLSVKIAKLSDKKGNLILTSYGRTDIPAGIIDKGKIKKADELVNLIKKSVENVEGEKLKTDFVVCSLPEQEAFIMVIQLPLLKASEIREAAKWKLEEYIPLKIEEVYFDYFVIDSTRKNLDHIDVLIGALPKEIVDDYVDVLKKSGLKIKAMEIESVATSRALIEDGFSAAPVFVIDIGAQRTSFTIFSGYTPILTTSSKISNNYLLDVMASKFPVSRQEVKKMKFEAGLNDLKSGEDIATALKEPLNELVSDVLKYIEFYKNYSLHEHRENECVSEIILCGGGANFSGLDLFLAQKTGIPVKLGNPLINILKERRQGIGSVLKKSDMEIPPINFNESLSYVTALGLALYGIK
ncbi:MAG: hypothetical protein US76_03540 [Parcubacteria group bacterium GW2011_GWA2_38_13b]|nr:MAG: hypothetical protein US76_03540 [Parcubacteria group bacterium GW2011_GWA2_38_13b]